MQRERTEREQMQQGLPTRFWVEVALAALAFGLFVLTLFTREWFELLTGLDPDGGSGSLEVVLAAAPLVVAIASVASARRSYLRAAATTTG